MSQEIEQFIQVCSKRYPNISFIEDRPQSTDSNNTPYVSLFIGGIKPEGSTLSLLCTLSKDDEALWKYWWDTMDKFVAGCREVRIRKAPEVSCIRVQELESFDYEFPTLVNKEYTQIGGRFSFYK